MDARRRGAPRGARRAGAQPRPVDPLLHAERPRRGRRPRLDGELQLRLARRRRDALARGPRRRRRLHRHRPVRRAGPDPGPSGRPVGDATRDVGRAAAPDAAPGRARPRRHAAAERLAHRAGGPAPAGRRLPAVDDRRARRPLPDHQQQRLVDADTDRRRHRSAGRSRPRCRSITRGSAWRGTPTATRLYSAGAAENTVNEFNYAERRLEAAARRW